MGLKGSGGGAAAVSAGGKVEGVITYVNNLPTRIVDTEISATVSGAFERTSVATQRGFYKSSENMIVWNKNDVGNLAVLNPGDSGSLSFSLSALPPDILSSLSQGQDITITVTVKGNRVSEANVPDVITSSAVGKIRISSNLIFSSKALYSVGAFKNTGPLPPRADQPTSYTIVWTLTNSLNRVGNVEVRAVLPQNVTWLNITGPAQESITYNAGSREIIWRAGEVKAGTGFKSSPRIVSFQVSLEPSLSQVGNAAPLVGPARARGEDTTSGAELSDESGGIDTLISTDPLYQDGMERVTN